MERQNKGCYWPAKGAKSRLWSEIRESTARNLEVAQQWAVRSCSGPIRQLMHWRRWWRRFSGHSRVSPVKAICIRSIEAKDWNAFYSHRSRLNRSSRKAGRTAGTEAAKVKRRKGRL